MYYFKQGQNQRDQLVFCIKSNWLLNFCLAPSQRNRKLMKSSNRVLAVSRFISGGTTQILTCAGHVSAADTKEAISQSSTVFFLSIATVSMRAQ